jgi:hypothetical protein
MGNKVKPEIHVHDASKNLGTLKAIGGSMSDNWNNILANQTIGTIWFSENTDPEEVKRRRHAAVDALIGLKPQDELVGMIAGQLLACHFASMECYRRAMVREQTFEGRRENLSQANKLSRTYATLLEALNRHRGKGTQRVTVEHVHVYSGGQAVVGTVETPGGGCPSEIKGQPHAITNSPGATLPCTNAARDRVSVPGDAERSVPDARRTISGRAKGQ